MDTTRDLTLSFYDDYGELSVYAKQGDTQRVIQFEFNEDIIPSNRDNFHVYVRGMNSQGIIISPFEIKQKTDISDYTVTFHVPSYFLEVPGLTQCDIVLTIGAAIFDDQSAIINEIQILSTHNFNIYVEALPTNGGVFTPVQQDQMDVLTRLIIEAESMIVDINKALYWQVI